MDYKPSMEQEDTNVSSCSMHKNLGQGTLWVQCTGTRQREGQQTAALVFIRRQQRMPEDKRRKITRRAGLGSGILRHRTRSSEPQDTAKRTGQ